MQADTLEIRPDIRAGLHALAASLAHERWALARMRECLARAEQGEFVPDEEMQDFFARCDA